MSFTKSEEFRALNAQDVILRQIFDHERICFKHCIKTPSKILSPEDEKCLKTCATKLMRGIDYLGKRDSNKKAILGDEPST